MFGFGRRQVAVNSEAARYAVAMNDRIVNDLVDAMREYDDNDYTEIPSEYTSLMREYEGTWDRYDQYLTDSRYQMYKRINKILQEYLRRSINVYEYVDGDPYQLANKKLMRDLYKEMLVIQSVLRG